MLASTHTTKVDLFGIFYRALPEGLRSFAPVLGAMLPIIAFVIVAWIVSIIFRRWFPQR